MKVCGVELKGGEAVICLLNMEGDVFNIPECRSRSITLTDPKSVEGIKEFQFTFSKLMEDYKVDEIIIITREQKGKFAGSAASFKMETAIQLSGTPVYMMSTKSIKEQIKRNPPLVDFAGLELKKFQQPAFEAAYAFQQLKIYKKI